MRVAAIQIRTESGHDRYHFRQAVAMLEEAAADQADLVVLPECWLSGYHLDRDRFCEFAETPDGDTIRFFREFSGRHKMAMVVPFVERGEGCMYNAVAVVDRGLLLGIHRKSYLWGREKDIFSPGPCRYPVFETGSGRIGVLICYEAEFPEPARMLALNGADLIVVPSVWSREAEPRWDIQLPARALDNTVFVAGVNTAGETSCGKSKMVAPDGTVLRESASDSREWWCCDTDLGLLGRVRERIPYLRDFRGWPEDSGNNEL